MNQAPEKLNRRICRFDLIMKKRYWLRDGITVGIIYSILFILYVVYAYSVEGNTSSGAGFGLSLIPLALSGFPAVLILDILPNFIKPTIDSLFGGILIMYIVNTLQWFIIGSFLGLLYGKIKNRV